MSNPTLDTSNNNAGTSGSSINWYHTCDASATLLLVHVSYTTMPGALSASYHSKPMALVKKYDHQAVFQLANPDTGSGYQVVVTADSAVLQTGFSSSWIGAGSIVARSSKEGSSNTAWLNRVVSSTNNLVLDFLSVLQASPADVPAPQGSQVVAYGGGTADGSTWCIYCSYVAGAASVNVRESWTNSYAYTYMAGDLGAGGVTPPAANTVKVTICIVGG